MAPWRSDPGEPAPSACQGLVEVVGVDTLVRGCTHSPLLARTIGDVMGRELGVRVLGPGAQTVEAWSWS